MIGQHNIETKDFSLELSRISSHLITVAEMMDEVNDARWGLEEDRVGIGINVNNSLDDYLEKTATSLIKEAGSKISRVKLLRSFLIYMDKNYCKLISDDYDSIRDSWFSYSNIIGKEILVRDEKDVTKGVVLDVDNAGCLILENNDGVKRILSGDVEYM